MSKTVFRGTSPNGATERELHVTQTRNDMVCFEIRDQAGRAMGVIYLDLDMAEGLGYHVRHRVIDMRDDLEDRP